MHLVGGDGHIVDASGQCRNPTGWMEDTWLPGHGQHSERVKHWDQSTGRGFLLTSSNTLAICATAELSYAAAPASAGAAVAAVEASLLKCVL